MTKIDDNSIMPFGKYKGEKMANVPPDYLIWLYENGKCYGDIKDYIAENMEVLKSEINYKNKSK
jgi:uncharacterized protein (DUF3820 family)